MYDRIIKKAEELGIYVKTNEPLKTYTSFRIGGPADVLIQPDSTESLSEILKACSDEGITPYILGRGSNVLVADDGVRGVVIVMGDAFSNIEYCGNNLLKVQAGASLRKVCRFCLDYSLSGMEFAYGIPGSIGGGVYMNAGAYGGELSDRIVLVNHMDFQGNKGSFQGKRELDLSYRHSRYMEEDLIITSVILYLEKGNPDAIKMKMDNIMDRRKLKQPLDYPSAGSTFKRPEGYFASKLIDDCGLRGKTIGGAQVSEKHAGFVINKGGATADDIKELIKYVEKTVKKETGVSLEPEIRFFP